MASQAFRHGITRYHNEPRLKITIGGTDYSNYLESIDQIRRDASLSIGTVTMTLKNHNGLFNYLHAAGDAMGITATVQLYLNGAPADLHTVFSGKVEDVNYKGAVCIMRVKDHCGSLLDKPMTAARDPHILGGSGMTVDEFVYRVLVSYGDLDSTQGTGNTDINWTSFSNWRDSYLATKDYHIQARFTDQSVGWTLLKVAQLTHSYIWIDNSGKVAFAPPYGTGYTYDEINTESRDLHIAVDDMINYMTVRYLYNGTTDRWEGVTGVAQNSTSIAQYGTYKYEEDSRVIYHYTQASAEEDRGQTITDLAYPIRTFDISTNIAAVCEDIGNEITVSDTLKGISSETAIIEQIVYELGGNAQDRKVQIFARWAW